VIIISRVPSTDQIMTAGKERSHERFCGSIANTSR